MRWLFYVLLAVVGIRSWLLFVEYTLRLRGVQRFHVESAMVAFIVSGLVAVAWRTRRRDFFQSSNPSTEQSAHSPWPFLAVFVAAALARIIHEAADFSESGVIVA
jgi:high-affinity Fe2+/Pb2+ permease